MKQRTRNPLSAFSQLADGVAEDWRNAKSTPPVIAQKALRQHTSKKKSKPDPRGFRWQMRVWLDENKPDHFDLVKWIEDLKCKRMFAPIFRNALLLYQELMAGEVAMLYQLFPNTQPPPPIITPEKLKEMEQEIKNLRIQVDILIKQQSPNAVDMGIKMSSVGQGAPVHTPRQTFAPKPSMAAPPPAVEVDTSTAFLDAF